MLADTRITGQKIQPWLGYKQKTKDYFFNQFNLTEKNKGTHKDFFSLNYFFNSETKVIYFLF